MQIRAWKIYSCNGRLNMDDGHTFLFVPILGLETVEILAQFIIFLQILEDRT